MMKWILMVLLLSMAAATGIMAQGPTTTLKWDGTSAFSSAVMVSVSPDGAVSIDWTAIDRVVADPGSNDPTTRAVAQALVAVRNGTWKPIR